MKEHKGDASGISLNLPQSWADGEMAVDKVEEYPEDGSLRVWQDVRESTNNTQKN